MAKTALNQLQDQIEAVRKEAFAAGYAAAMQQIRDLASRPAPSAPQGAASAQPARAATRRGRAAGPGRPARQPRQPAPAAKPAAANKAAPATRGPRARTAGAGRAEKAARTPRSGGRLQRGNNARLIEEVLQSIAPRAARPAEIRTALQRDKGVDVAFTSIRHALGQLEARNAIEQVGDSKTWRHRGQSSAD
jgi:hypothetical protein